MSDTQPTLRKNLFGADSTIIKTNFVYYRVLVFFIGKLYLFNVILVHDMLVQQQKSFLNSMKYNS